MSLGAREQAHARSITAPLLAAFFTGLLCRTAKLSPQGKTTTGVIIGLGDEGVGELKGVWTAAHTTADTDSSTMVVYGQRQGDAAHPTLRLCVGRKRAAPPPAEKKVRPGEPLPRCKSSLDLYLDLSPPTPVPYLTLQHHSSRKSPSGRLSAAH